MNISVLSIFSRKFDFLKCFLSFHDYYFKNHTEQSIIFFEVLISGVFEKKNFKFGCEKGHEETKDWGFC